MDSQMLILPHFSIQFGVYWQCLVWLGSNKSSGGWVLKMFLDSKPLCRCCGCPHFLSAINGGGCLMGLASSFRLLLCPVTASFLLAC